MRRISRPASAAALALGLLALCACGAVGARTSTTARLTPRTVTADPSGPGPAAAVAGTNRLALELLGRLGAAGNAVLSPYSIETALAMVDQGARGQTAAQIANVLGGAGATTLAASNRALLTSLDATAGAPSSAAHASLPTLDDANSLWLQSGLALERAFTMTLAADFGAAPQTVDFTHAPQEARAAINAWVAAQTEQLIPELMPPGSVTAYTRLVLANAIYLKARWESPFDVSLTAPAQFVLGSGQSVKASFMNTEEPIEVPYASGEGYAAVELPYRSSTLALLAIMPASGSAGRFERDLSAARLGQIERSLRRTLIGVHMPLLKLTLHDDLSGALAALGMPIAFTPRADFSGIAGSLRLQISTVQHAALLKVDEAGTVAAAATGIGIVGTAAPVEAASITLNHPFLAFLVDRATGAILFEARVVDPREQ